MSSNWCLVEGLLLYYLSRFGSFKVRDYPGCPSVPRSISEPVSSLPHAAQCGCGPGSGLVLCSFHQSQAIPDDLLSFREGALSGQIYLGDQNWVLRGFSIDDG